MRNVDANKKAPKIGAFFVALRSYLRRARLNPSSASSPSKFIQPSAPAPAFNGAFADEVGAVEPPAPVAVPCSVMSRAGTLPTKVTRKVAVLAPAAVGTNSKPIAQLAPGCMTPPFTHAVWPAATVALLKLATCPVPGLTAGFPSVMAVPALFVRRTGICALVAPTAVLGERDRTRGCSRCR